MKKVYCDNAASTPSDKEVLGVSILQTPKTERPFK